MTGSWVVVLEMARPSELDVIDRDAIQRLLGAVADSHPVALLAYDRYALQLHIVADGPAEALLVGLSRFRDATGRLCMRPWDLVRAEVQTSAEFEQECNRSALAGSARLDPAASEGVDGEAVLQVAFHDPLTHLATESLFADCLERSLVSGAAAGRVHALILVCPEGLTDIGDRLDPSEADAVVSALAGRLAATVRDGDVVARLSGGRFGVLLRNTAPSSALSAAERIAERLEPPIALPGKDVTVPASVGVAVGQTGQGGTQLLQEAAAAVALATRSGGNKAVLFSATGLVPTVGDLRFGRVDLDP